MNFNHSVWCSNAGCSSLFLFSWGKLAKKLERLWPADPPVPSFWDCWLSRPFFYQPGWIENMLKRFVKAWQAWTRLKWTWFQFPENESILSILVSPHPKPFICLENMTHETHFAALERSAWGTWAFGWSSVEPGLCWRWRSLEELADEIEGTLP